MRVERINGITIILPEGRVDSCHAQTFINDITKEISKVNAKVLVDMTEITLFTSSGLRALLIGAKLAFGGRGFAICGPNEYVHDLLKAAGFDKILKCYATRELALAKM